MKEIPFDSKAETIIESFKTIPVFDSLDEGTLRSLIKDCSIRQYSETENVIEQGAYDNWVYFLVYGELEISVDGKVVGHLRRLGDVFGEMGIIDGSPRSATITATRPTLVVGMDSGSIADMGRGQRTFVQGIMYNVFAKVMAVRLRDTSKQLAEVQSELDELKKKYGEA